MSLPPSAYRHGVFNGGDTDGIDDNNGLPYTEITLGIEETLRGGFPDATCTFRQIGLLNPRLNADGTKMMLAAPEGMPK